DRMAAAGVEGAAGWGIDRAWHVAIDFRLEAFDPGIGHGNGSEQRLGIGMARVGEQFGLLRQFDDPSKIHHRDAVTDVGDHGKVMRDEEVGESVPALEIDKEVDDLGLDRHVERRYRLVAHDQAWFERQRPCDADALPLAAGELVRVVLHLIRSQSDLFEQLGNPIALLVTSSDAVDAERLADNIAGSHPWIERGEWILENDLHGAPDRTQLG